MRIAMPTPKSKTGLSRPLRTRPRPNPPPSRRFAAGQSGNPRGRPLGARNAAAAAVDAVLTAQARAIGQAVVDLALTGNTQALRLCLERLAPPSRARTLNLDLPKMATTARVAAGLDAVLAAVAQGAIDTTQAEALARLIEAKRAALETAELDQRVARIEREIDARSPPLIESGPAAPNVASPNLATSPEPAS
jgi:hypothetical protein